MADCVNKGDAKPTRYWAVGFKGWVELRTHPTAPKAIRSVLEMEVEVRPIHTFNPTTGMYERTKPVKRKHEIKTVAYDGGAVIKVVTTNRFYKLTTHLVPPNGLTEISAASAAKVKASKGYGL